ncbi:MAG: FAD-dependent oxidoreductase, partial [Gammaproteobacteria bacterium]|nr:FAD-dependent oxidoreductase [Gammaproteobacteria bacterium]
FLPGDRQVDNRRLMQALVKAASAAGVRFRTHTPVAEWQIESGRGQGIRTATGETLQAGIVVNALGCWAGRIPPLGSR